MDKRDPSSAVQDTAPASATSSTPETGRSAHVSPPGFSAAIESYLRELRPEALLTREQEGELGHRLDTGFERALNVVLSLGVPLLPIVAQRIDARKFDAISRRPVRTVRRLLRRLEALEAEAEMLHDSPPRKRRRSLEANRNERASLMRELQPRREICAEFVEPVRASLQRYAAVVRDGAAVDVDDADPREARLIMRATEQELRRSGATLRQAHRQLERAFAEIDAARHRLTRSNLRLVITFAKKYKNHGLPLEDLIQEGNVGLMRAADKFDPRAGTRFSTYAAWWIRQSIQRAIVNHGTTVRMPVHLTYAKRLARRTKTQLANKLQREPELSEIAGVLGISVENTRRNLEAGPRSISMNAPVGGDGELVLGDTFADDNEAPPDSVATENESQDQARRLVATLTPREQRVMALRYGLGGTRAHTLHEIGEFLGLTRERIRQIEHKSLQKLRRAARLQPRLPKAM